MLRLPPERIVGALNRPDWEERRVRLQPLHGGPKILYYDAELHDQVGAAWGKYVVGQMVVEEPENPSLPRAPRRVRTLVRIEHVYESADDIPSYLRDDA